MRTKLCSLVVLGALIWSVQSAGCAGRSLPAGVTEVGRVQHPRMTESSGIAASLTQKDVFWTHTDGGARRNPLVAMSRTGGTLAEFSIIGPAIEDWEDIAAAPNGRLYIADIGNNDARRSSLTVHEVNEPTLGAAGQRSVQVNRSWRLTFPGKPFDCESLIVWKDHGYVISKVFNDAKAELHRFSLTNAAPAQVLELVGKLKIESPVTAAALSPDGMLLGIVAKNGAYVYRVNGDPASAVGAGKPHQVKLRDEHIEGCTFVPEGLLATAETRAIFLFSDPAFRSPAQK